MAFHRLCPILENVVKFPILQITHYRNTECLRYAFQNINNYRREVIGVTLPVLLYVERLFLQLANNILL